MTHPWFEGGSRPRILAHRGLVTPQAARDGVVENSFTAVAAAQAEGVEYVESDCHLTADGHVLLFHDADLARVAGDPRPVSEVRLAEIEDLMAARGGAITLPQALEAFPTLRFNLDVKATAAAEPVGRAVAAHADRVLVTSFSDERRRDALRAAAARGGVPATSAGRSVIARALLASLVSHAALRRALSGVDALQVPVRQGGVPIVTGRFLRRVHQAGVEVHVWTINDPERMRELVDLGVDGIVTDRADLAMRTLR